MKISAVPLVAFTGFLLIGSVIQGSPQAEVRISRGKPALFLKGKETPPFAYMSYFGETHLYREIAATGIHLFCFPAYLGDRGINSTTGIGPFRSPIWTGPESYDFSSIREDFTELLKADRQAMAIIRIHLDVPGWWEKKYPDECSRQPDGTCIRQSFSSQVWRSQAGEALQQIVLWLMKSQYRDNLAGIHVSGGFTEEWFYHFNDEFHDLSPARKMAFREWLKEEYGSSLSSACQCGPHALLRLRGMVV